MLTFTIKASGIKALLAHASKDECRLPMYGIGVGDGALVATDGHRLLTAPLETFGKTGYCEAMVIPRELVERALKVCGPSGSVTFDCNGPSAVVSVTAISKLERALGTFSDVALGVSPPPYQQVIPRYDVLTGCARMGFDPRYLGELELVRDATEHMTPVSKGIKSKRAWCEPVFMFPSGELDPMRFECGPWTAVVMPMRISNR